GFTLLELMVGISIFSLVIVVLYAGYRLSIRSWESGERTHASVSELRLAGSFIRRHVTQAFPLAVSKSNAWRLWFQGDRQRLVFVTAMPAHLGQGGMYEMTLAVDKLDDSASLMVSRRLLHPDAAAGQPGVDDQPRPLVENLESAEFAFFGANGDDGPETWQKSWQDRQRLPRLVRVRLRSRLAGEWPEIVISLPTDAIRYQRTVASGGPGQRIPEGTMIPGAASILAPGSVQ
ncbi:MAG: prepilin-type N-terminal cleavage/methylation domain-containing protein, partial [Lysobacterales bacterium]